MKTVIIVVIAACFFIVVVSGIIRIIEHIRRGEPWSAVAAGIKTGVVSVAGTILINLASSYMYLVLRIPKRTPVSLPRALGRMGLTRLRQTGRMGLSRLRQIGRRRQGSPSPRRIRRRRRWRNRQLPRREVQGTNRGKRKAKKKTPRLPSRRRRILPGRPLSTEP